MDERIWSLPLSKTYKIVSLIGEYDTMVSGTPKRLKISKGDWITDDLRYGDTYVVTRVEKMNIWCVKITNASP